MRLKAAGGRSTAAYSTSWDTGPARGGSAAAAWMGKGGQQWWRWKWLRDELNVGAPLGAPLGAPAALAVTSEPVVTGQSACSTAPSYLCRHVGGVAPVIHIHLQPPVASAFPMPITPYVDRLIDKPAAPIPLSPHVARL